MGPKHRFASSEWVDELRRVVLDHCAPLDLSGIDYSISEELTDPPAGLGEPGATSIGWHLRIRDGVVEVGHTPLADATVRIVADYATVEPIARVVLGHEVAERESVNRLLADARRAGLFVMYGEPREPEVLRDLDLHDVMAVRT